VKSFQMTFTFSKSIALS